jgi:hypothetical protein
MTIIRKHVVTQTYTVELRYNVLQGTVKIFRIESATLDYYVSSTFNCRNTAFIDDYTQITHIHENQLTALNTRLKLNPV